MDLKTPYESCCLCPRRCAVDRTGTRGKSHPGFCGETDRLRVGYVGPHFGEEPPITGQNGSGTVFFTGCSLKCSYCQNHQISQGGVGTELTLDRLLERIGEMIRVHQVHNLNLVTADHFFPHAFHLVERLRKGGFSLPVVHNLSGYQSVGMLKAAQDFVDIYLPDFKYSDSSLAARLSACPDYPDVALGAISEMIRQKGVLDACLCDKAIARKGVLVRHLILPGKITNSINALTSLFLEFGAKLPLSLMSQYHPVLLQKDPDLNRFLSREEFEEVYEYAVDLGFECLFVQFPQNQTTREHQRSPFLPDFRQEKPFEGRAAAGHVGNGSLRLEDPEGRKPGVDVPWRVNDGQP